MASRRRNRNLIFALTTTALLFLIDADSVLAETPSPLLTFTGAKEGRVAVESGKLHLLHIHYETELDWSHFKATADGKDVTSYFHPKPRTAEPITVPLAVGDNLLEFEVGRYPDKNAVRGTDAEPEVYELMVRVIEPVKRLQTTGARTLAVPPPRE